MKKLFSFLMLFFFGILLISCGSEEKPAKITYVDPSTGETVEMEVEATDDAAKIADVVSKLQPTSEMPKGITVTGNIKMDSETDVKVLGQSVKIVEDFDANLELKTNLVDKHYLNASFTYITKNNGVEVKPSLPGIEVPNSVSLTVYGDAENVYAEGKVDDETDKIYMPIEVLMDEFEGLMDNFVEGDYDSSVAPMTATTPSFEEMTPEQIIDFLNISISSTTESTIQFKLPLTIDVLELVAGEEIPLESDKTIDIYVTVQTATLLPTYLKVDASAFILDYLKSMEDAMTQGNSDIEYDEYNPKSATFVVEFNMNYDEVKNIPTLTEDQKAEYTPYLSEDEESTPII